LVHLLVHLIAVGFGFIDDVSEDHRLVRLKLAQAVERDAHVGDFQLVGDAFVVVERAMLQPGLATYLGHFLIGAEVFLFNRDHEAVDVFTHGNSLGRKSIQAIKKLRSHGVLETEGRKRGKTPKEFYTRCVCESYFGSEASRNKLTALDDPTLPLKLKMPPSYKEEGIFNFGGDGGKGKKSFDSRPLKFDDYGLLSACFVAPSVGSKPDNRRRFL